jgi:SAM-dependent methyltransferase
MTMGLTSRALRKLALELRRLRGRIDFSLGAAAHTTPLCNDFGGSRGTPIDRLYIENFLEAHRSDIRGRVLEIGDPTYSRRFGGSKVTRQDVLHVSGSPEATIVGALEVCNTLPSNSFDCIILTQTLQLIFDVPAAIDQLRGSLREGGVLLLTVPGITPIDRFEWADSWYWSFTKKSVERLLAAKFDASRVSVDVRGNLYAATAFLHGACLQEVQRSKLDEVDKAYPVTITARAVA